MTRFALSVRYPYRASNEVGFNRRGGHLVLLPRFADLDRADEVEDFQTLHERLELRFSDPCTGVGCSAQH